MSHPFQVACIGLGARALFDDQELFPIRGQVVRIAKLAVAGSNVFERADGNFGYVVEREEDLILGGTAEHGNWSLEPDNTEVERIVERCAQVDPALQHAKVLETRVGLRPGRSLVRLEAQRLHGKLIVHNYGHGGCGITLSHGCAEDVVRILGRELGTEAP